MITRPWCYGEIVVLADEACISCAHRLDCRDAFGREIDYAAGFTAGDRVWYTVQPVVGTVLRDVDAGASEVLVEDEEGHTYWCRAKYLQLLDDELAVSLLDDELDRLGCGLDHVGPVEAICAVCSDGRARLLDDQAEHVEEAGALIHRLRRLDDGAGPEAVWDSTGGVR